MATIETARITGGEHAPTFGEFFKVWFKIGCINSGGPAGQIAMMHRVVVDREEVGRPSRGSCTRSISACCCRDRRRRSCDLHRLAAARRAWRPRRRRPVRPAGRAGDAGPEPALCARARVHDRGRRAVRIKAAVLVIVVEALIRIGKRALKTSGAAGARGGGLHRHFFFALPFPLIVVAAAAIAW